MNISIMKFSFFVFLLFSMSSSVKAEMLLCQKMKGVMINEQGELIKIPLDSESIIQIEGKNVVVTTNNEKVSYLLILNTENVVHFSNITQTVFEIFSYYPKSGKLFYSKHSQIGYNSQYSTLCIKVDEER